MSDQLSIASFNWPIFELRYSYHAKFCLRYMYWLEIFRGIPYLLQRGVDSLSHTAQWAASVDLLPCCKKSYSCGEAHFRSGLFAAQYRICVHTLDCHLRAAKKQQARRSSARGKLESEKVGLPWAWPGVLEGRSQPHSPGWARVPLSSFVPQILMNLFYPIFPQTLLIFFLILVLRVGGSPTREGPGYATDFNQIHARNIIKHSNNVSFH